MIVDYVRLAFATGVVLLPGFLIGRALGQRSTSAGIQQSGATLNGPSSRCRRA